MTTLRGPVALFGAAVIGAVFILSVALAGLPAQAGAQESAITFPVAELGNCGSKEACHAYCDDLSHVEACVAFAESHGLMSADEASRAREFARLGGKGPGGCTSKDSCEAYCEDPAHLRQCIAFAKQSGVMDERELQEAEKVAAYLEEGGATPGNCRGEKQCKAYCEAGEHMEECVEFAIKMGFMSAKEAETFKKTGGVGPGGCRGRECEAYCEDEANREQCVAFALEHDLMSEEDKRRMEEGREQAKQALEKAPPAVLSCIEAALGAEKVAQLRRGEGFIGPALGDVLPRCFKEMMGDGSRGPFGPGSDATDCMRKVFGDDFEDKMRNGELDPGARDQEIRECMQSQMGEGFLNDQGRWKSPERGGPLPEREERMPTAPWDGEAGDDAGRRPEGGYRPELQNRYDEGRRRMEEQMRAQMEERMRYIKENASSLDYEHLQRLREGLPGDFRPEGAFRPEESFRRPPEEGGAPSGGYPPPPDGMQPQGTMMPPDGDSATAPPETFEQPPQSPSEPTSMLNPFLANVLSVVISLLGGR